MNKKTSQFFLKVYFFISILIILFSSLIDLYKNKTLLKNYIFTNLNTNKNKNFSGTEEDKKWAKEILKGGYIVHFRHAEREKWIDVEMYDLLESNILIKNPKKIKIGEEEYFKNAVCLNNRGLIQAKAIGEHLNNINFPIGFVISSPSCRSRQTALLAFGGYQITSKDLIYGGSYVDKKNIRNKNLLELYLSLPIQASKNTIVSSHNKVINSEILVNKNYKDFYLEEGGFFILSRSNNKLYLEHKFQNFNDFIRQFYKR